MIVKEDEKVMQKKKKKMQRSELLFIGINFVKQVCETSNGMQPKRSEK